MTGDPILDRLIERSTELWLAAGLDRTQPHNAVLLCESPEKCYVLTMRVGSTTWTIHQRPLDTSEIGELYAAFGAHWNLIISSLIRRGSDTYYRIIKFIKNGRKKTNGWSFCMDLDNPIILPTTEVARCITVDKTRQCVRFLDETEDRVTIAIENL